MRCVLQRVTEARVDVDGQPVGAIGPGLLLLLGIGPEDGAAEIAWMTQKIATLRIFEDDDGKMNLSLLDVKGELLVVSQFTLYGDCRKGRRPSFQRAAPPAIAEPAYEDFCTAARAMGISVQTGRFGADMKVSLVNDGPVTLVLDR